MKISKFTFMAVLLMGAITLQNKYVFAETQKSYSVKRLAGIDRYETSLKIVNEFANGNVENIIVASGNSFPDALAASNLSSKYNAPILLVDSSVDSSKAAIAYINEHLNKYGTIYVLGGTGVVSEDYVNAFKLMGFSKVVRLGGKDRYETNGLIVRELNVSKGTPVVIVNGANYPYALSVSSIAALKGYTILLSDKDKIPESIQARINEINPMLVYIIGDNSLLEDSIIDKVKKLIKIEDNNIIRIYGTDKYKGAIEISKHFQIDSDTIVLANGENFPDALSGTALATKLKAPIILTNGTEIAMQKEYIDSTQYTNLILLGGNGSINQKCEGILKDAIYSIEDISATVMQGEVYEFPEKVTATMYDNSKIQYPITWLVSTANTSSEGTYLFQGNVNGYDKDIMLTLNVTKRIQPARGNSVGNIVNGGRAAGSGNSLYFRGSLDSVFDLLRLNIETGKKTLLSEDKYVSYINVVGDWIYYQNNSDNYKLYKIKTDGTSKTKINDDEAFYINVVENWIYYFNQSDKGKLYRVKTDGTEKTKINDDWSHFLNVVDNWIYYKNGSFNNQLYKIKVDGTNRKVLTEDSVDSINVVDGWIYYKNLSDQGKLYKIKIDGTAKAKLSDDTVSYINASGNYIYFSNESDGRKLYKIQTNGEKRTKLSEDKASYINVIDNNIYYSNDSDTGKVYSIKTDGTERKPLEQITIVHN